MEDKEKIGTTGNMKDSDSGREPIVGGQGGVVVTPVHIPDSDKFSNSATTGLGPTKLGSKRNITGSGVIINK